jgi:hypothetical protein
MVALKHSDKIRSMAGRGRSTSPSPGT